MSLIRTGREEVWFPKGISKRNEPNKTGNIRKILDLLKEHIINLEHFPSLLVRWMGNDGGSIPRREELVKLKKKKVQVEKGEQNRSKWGLCTLTKQPLAPPIAVDKLGFLYNKVAVLEALVEGSLPIEFSHIQKSKRVSG